MPTIEWDSSLELGDAMIDQQHKSLVALINKVYEVRQSPDRDVEIMQSLTAMYLYAKEHFFDEEGLMERLGYPERARHLALHKTFVDKTRTLTDSCLNDSLDFDELMDFLVNWLKRHITIEDAKILRFATTHGETRA